MDMLEYSKLILSRVSFSPELFRRELQKSIDTLDNNDIDILKTWCIKEFGKSHPEILVDSFQLKPYPKITISNKKSVSKETMDNK